MLAWHARVSLDATAILIARGKACQPPAGFQPFLAYMPQSIAEAAEARQPRLYGDDTSDEQLRRAAFSAGALT